MAYKVKQATLERSLVIGPCAHSWNAEEFGEKFEPCEEFERSEFFLLFVVEDLDDLPGFMAVDGVSGE